MKQLSPGVNSNLRCTNFGAPPDTPSQPLAPGWRAKEYWQGNFINIPGAGQQEVLRRDSAVNTNVPDDGQATPLVTTGLWAIRCLGSLASTGSATPVKDQGEGFLAISPDGTRYRFDWLVSRTAGGMSKQASLAGAHVSMERVDVRIFPTLITDRFGNTVSYTFDPIDKWKLLSIQSSDGRSLSFTYEPGSRRIKTVSDGTRTWTYEYGAVSFPSGLANWTSLMKVINPDGSKWDFAGMHLPNGYQSTNNGLVDMEMEFPEQNGGTITPTECDMGAINGMASPAATGSMVHPSSAVGTFTLTPTEHGRNGVPEGCYSDAIANSVGKAVKSRYSTVFALTKKTISGPGLPTMNWVHSYDTWYPGWSTCSACTGAVAKVTVTDPEGDITRHTFGNTFQVNEGQPLKVETGLSGGTAARTVDTRYSSAFPNPVGISDQDAGDGGITTRHVPVDKRVTTQQGTTFTYEVTGFDPKARPTNVKRSSGLGFERTEITTYFDQLSKWVLGQIATVIIDGKTSVSNVYDPTTATLTTVSKFGELQNSYTYRSDGTLETRKDGRNNLTTFGVFKRGIPQSVSLPTGDSHSAVVNDIGLVTSVTDEMSNTTSFGYDAMGRLSSITPPSGWTPTTISYVQTNDVEFGLPGGHWRVIETTGNSITASYLDGLWRPVFSRVYDTGDVNNTRKDLAKRYDSGNRTTYESYPKRLIDTALPLPPGKRTFYDALGRPIRSEVDSEIGMVGEIPGVLKSYVEYLGNFQTRSTNARGKQSTQNFWVLDNPDRAQLAGISVPAGSGVPAGMSVAITRDLLGKPLSITRSGNGVSVTRSYLYDSAQRLCKTIEPEIGSTLQDYDSAGNLAWRASGQNLPTLECDRTNVPAAAKISHTYDELNRLKDTSYGDGHPGISRTYWPDGKLKTINTSDDTAWSYDYNTLRLPTTETLTYASKTANVTWSYNANGHLSGVTYPTGGPSVSYNPNALGEATQVSGYASGVTYHPNGTVAGYTLSNGIARVQTQNLRGLPERNQYIGVTNDLYAYDENGNISAISDQQENVTTRAMTYDDLDRLWTATSPNVWGTATYTYDAVDNIRTAVVGSRSSTMSYDARNRLESVMTNGTLSNYAYDAQGNIRVKGAQEYWFDIGNRMWKSNPGGTYVYDGHGRRVFIISTDGNTKRLQMYSQAGQILWGDRTQTTPDVPATVTGYTCSAGTVSGSLCVSTSVYNASVTGYQCNPGDSLSGTTCSFTTSSTYGASIGSYSCNAGDGLSGSTCTHITTSTYGAAPSYGCNPGDTLSGSTCSFTTTSTYGASIGSYQCSGGDALSGSTCTHTVTSTYGGTPIYACNAGDSLSGTTCTHTSSAAATSVYSCPANYSLSGTTCTTTTSAPANANANCHGLGTAFSTAGTYGCSGDVAAQLGEYEDESVPCLDAYGGYGLPFMHVARKSNKLLSCVFQAVVTYSCPQGTSLNGTQCTGSSSQPASVSYSCSSGSLSGTTCFSTSTYGAGVSGYSCNAGDSLGGSTCTHTASNNYGATPIYSCSAGDSLSGTTCTHVANGTYPAATIGYTCSAGDSLSGSTCTHAVPNTYGATPIYTCNAGDSLSGQTCTHSSGGTYAASPAGYSCNSGDALSGATCTHTTQAAATPVYGCSGGTLSGTTCVGGTATSTTAYIYLGKTQIAETTSGITQFAHTDALGSPVAHTTATGALLNRTRYEPYGFTAQGTKPSPATSVIGFTGHVNDADTDLVYMQQRYYDPIAGRFLSVDPVTTDLDTGEQFGRYSYVDNNPYSRVDPDGRLTKVAVGVATVVAVASMICESCKREIAKGIAAIAQSIQSAGI
ncbi:RHS repeat-associated core domain-containing protein [Roseateles chitinivorans]|uniref:RHS repeat-associated core domain-containing protein n=1 Tax=Roseateles chitinivorans TaxID=2917965 RepID=UPI003D67CC0E